VTVAGLFLLAALLLLGHHILQKQISLGLVSSPSSYIFRHKGTRDFPQLPARKYITISHWLLLTLLKPLQIVPLSISLVIQNGKTYQIYC
jgi:hypothetical protein